MCFYSKELREPMLKAYELRSECDKLEKLCKFLQERLDEASALYIFDTYLTIPHTYVRICMHNIATILNSIMYNGDDVCMSW